MFRVLAISIFLAVMSGCSAKVKLVDGASSVRTMNANTEELYSCKYLSSDSVEDLHPNNVNKTIKNMAYMDRATHYRITSITSTDYKGRMTGAAFDLYKCGNTYKQQ